MKEKVLELLNDEVYEICDSFEPESVADLIVTIVKRIGENASMKGIGKTVMCELGKYQFKVCNKNGGFVSCSDTDECRTTVSETLYFPYYYDKDDPDAGLKNLIEMVNEAFYACENY